MNPNDTSYDYEMDKSTSRYIWVCVAIGAVIELAGIAAHFLF